MTEIVGIVQNAIARGQLADELADALHLPLHFVLLLLAVHESLPQKLVFLQNVVVPRFHVRYLLLEKG